MPLAIVLPLSYIVACRKHTIISIHSVRLLSNVPGYLVASLMVQWLLLSKIFALSHSIVPVHTIISGCIPFNPDSNPPLEVGVESGFIQILCDRK